MFAFLFVFVVFVRTLINASRDPAMQGLLLAVAVILFGGTAFYCFVEEWSVVDSLYFCVTTLTTVGFGDPAPKEDVSKLFTCLYLLMGLGVIATFATTIVKKAPIWQREIEREAELAE